MGKIFNKFFIRSLIVFGLMIVSVNICNAAVTVTVTADANTVTYGGKTVIRWKSTGANTCTLPDAYGGWTAQTSGSFTTNPLYTNTSFIITCTGYSTPSSGNYYYKLQRCRDNALAETGPFPSGKYSTGDVLAGALDDGSQDYRVIGSSTTSYGINNIQTTNPGLGHCR